MQQEAVNPFAPAGKSLAPDYQIAYGFCVELADGHAPYAAEAMTLFDYRTDHFEAAAAKHGEGPEACASWLYQYPEYSQPLGEPKSDYTVTKTSLDLNCTLLDDPPTTKDVSGCLFYGWARRSRPRPVWPRRGVLRASTCQSRGQPSTR